MTNKTPHLHLYWRAAKETVEGLQVQPDQQWGILLEPGHEKFAVYKHCHDQGKGKKVWVPLVGKFESQAEALEAINTHLAERAGDAPR